MATIRNFEDLDVWKNAVDFAVDIYKMSETGKLKSDFGMKDQIRRAACSVSNNIAEGFEQNNNRVFLTYLRYAKGSAGETRNQLTILFKAELINEETFNSLKTKTILLSKQISSLIKYLTGTLNNQQQKIQTSKSN